MQAAQEYLVTRRQNLFFAGSLTNKFADPEETTLRPVPS